MSAPAAGPADARSGPPPALWGAITDVPGVLVGQAQRIGDGWLSGVTVVQGPPGTVGAVDVRGGGPGTHETDALDPTTLVPTVDAVTLTGGSAYGLASAGGVQRWCEEHGRGVPVGPPEDPGRLVVPIVPAAAVFDLGRGGDPAARPGPDLGYAAAAALAAHPPERGTVGAGTGALLGTGTVKGGVGTASVQLGDGVVVGALAVVNAFGFPFDAVTGALLGTAFVPPGLPRPPAPAPEEAQRVTALVTGARRPPGRPAVPPPLNTTIAVVATNAAMDPARARRTATAAHSGLARALDPAHTLFDGDTVFALSTGAVELAPALHPQVHAAAATALLLAILDGVRAATAVPASAGTAVGTVPAYADLVRVV